MSLTLLTPKGFCTADDVAAFLSITFTPAQAPFVDSSIARVERFIEQECNREFSVGPVVGEDVFSPYGLNPPSFFTNYVSGWVPLGADVRVKNTPVQSVERVQGTGWLDSTPVLLVRNLDYEVRDLSQGLVRIVTPSAYYKVTFDYTPVNACPIDVGQATIMQVATWLQPMLNPDSWAMDSFRLPDLEVKWNQLYTKLDIHPAVEALINNYRFRITA